MIRTSTEDLKSDSKVELFESPFKKILLSRDLPSVTGLADTALIPLIGGTGSGKSTVLNYLMGSKMKPEKIGGKNVISTESSYPYAKIGHAATTQTLYPEIHRSRTNGYAYCEFPSSSKSMRDIGVETLNSLGMELIIESAKNIPAVIIVVSYSELNFVRAILFLELIKKLGNLFRNSEEIANSLLFVVTKVPEGINEKDILEQIGEILRYSIEENAHSFKKLEKRDVNEHPSNSTIGEINELKRRHRELVILEGIVQHKNLFVIDVLDSKSKEKIELWMAVRKERALTASSFDFDSYDEYHVEFNTWMFEVASEGARLLQAENAFQTQVLEKEKIRAEKKGYLKDEGDNKVKTDGIKNNIKILEKKLNITFSKSKLAENPNEILEEQIQDLDKRIKNIELSDKEVLFWYKDIIRVQPTKQTGWSWWSNPLIEEVVSYKGIPFTKALTTSGEGGQFKVMEHNPKQGVYKSMYQCDYNKPTGARVEIYVQEKNTPQSKEMVKRLREELANKQSLLEQREREATDPVEEIEQKIAQLEEKLSGITEEINVNFRLFDLVEKISTILKHKHPFNTEIVTTFVQLLGTRRLYTKLDVRKERLKKYQDRLEACLYEAIKIGDGSSAVLCLTTLQQMRQDGQLQGQLLLAGTDKNKEPALFTLTRFNRTGWLETFLNYFDLFTRDEQGNTVLHVAAQYGDFAFCEVLIAAGMLQGDNIWPQNNKGETPFHIAALTGKVDLMLYLATRYYAENELSISTFNGDTIVHLLVRAKHLVALERLLAAYPELSLCIKNTKGQDALMESVLTQDVNLVKSLIRANVDLASQDNEGQTALHLAVLFGQLEIVKVLVERGAYLELRNKQDKEPIELASPFDPIGIYLSNYSLQQRPQKYFSQQKLPCRNLIFQGVGVEESIAYLGALRALEKEGICDLSNVRLVGGSSTGAITALLVGLNYSLDEIEDIMLHKLHLREFLDGPWGEKLLKKKDPEVIQRLQSIDIFLAGIGQILDGAPNRDASLLKPMKEELRKAYKDVKEKFGLCPGKKPRDLFAKLIQDKLFEKAGIRAKEEVTFAELAQYTDFKLIYFVGVNVDTGEQEIFSAEHTPDMVVADALRISMSIPGIFEPYYKITKGKDGQLHTGKTLYVDGGFLWNYPTEMFDFHRYQLDPKGAQDFQVGYETIELNLISSKLQQQRIPKLSRVSRANTVEEFWSYVKETIGEIYNNEESDHKEKGNAFRTIYIGTSVRTFDFDITEAVQAQLIKAGQEAVLEFERSVENDLSTAIQLPQTLELIILKYLEKPSLRMQYDQLQMTGRSLLNPNCPDLVVAFYAQKENATILRNYLHQMLQISLWARDKEGNTAFHIAARDNVEALEALLAVDPNGEKVCNFAGETPANFARKAKKSISVSGASNEYTQPTVLFLKPAQVKAVAKASSKKPPPKKKQKAGHARGTN